MHIVVLAYGPAPRTKRAVHRARKLVGTGHAVSVVAASPVGREAIANLAGAAKAEGMGTAGLRHTLFDLGDEPALIIHDDVVLTMRGTMALERELAAGARYVIPYSNDPGMDHYIGSLPAGKEAERVLDEIRVPGDSIPAVQIRPACIAAKASDLTALLGESLPDPYASINSTELGFVVAGGAVAAHETECLHRLAEPADDPSPLLVAALIVKDEETMLPECLTSLQGVCDRIEICDTGSSDGTVAIAAAAGAGVSHTEWTDDFGAARNAVLERCRDARYVLVVDADERMVCPDPEQTRRYLATYAHEHPAFRVEISNLSADNTELYRFTTVRIFTAAGTEYRGALHEAVHLQGDPLPLNGHRFDQIRLEHSGYASEIVDERAKTLRNLEIAETQHQADNDARSAVHLARSLAYANQSPERALELLEQGLAGARGDAAKAQIMGLMADRLMALGEYRRAFDTAAAALELLPGDTTALGALGAAAHQLGNHEEFITIGEAQQGANEAKHIVTIDHNRLVFQDCMVAAYAASGRVDQAAETAVALLTENSSALHSWPLLIESLCATYGVAAMELLVPIALLDETGGFLPPLITAYPSKDVASFCAAYLDRGGRITETIRVGLLAAAMSGNDDAFAAILPEANNLDQSIRDSLAVRVATGGRPDLAAKLRTERVGAHH